MNPRPGVLVNPLSGRNRRRPVDIAGLSERFSVPVREVAGRVDIDRALEEFLHLGVNVIVISSGDGTVQALHTSIFSGRNYSYVPPMVIIPGGTTNMTAADVGIGSSLQHALELLISPGFYRKARLEFRDIIRLTVPDSGEYYGLYFATAGICDAMAWYRTHMHEKGAWGLPGIVLTFVRVLLHTLFSSRTLLISPLKIEARFDDGEVLCGKFILFFITTLNRLLWGMRPYAPRAKGPAYMHLCALHPGAEGVARESWHLLFKKRFSGNILERDGFYMKDVRRAELWLDGDVALDGELYRVSSKDRPVVVETGGRCPFIKVVDH